MFFYSYTLTVGQHVENDLLVSVREINTCRKHKHSTWMKQATNSTSKMCFSAWSSGCGRNRCAQHAASMCPYWNPSTGLHLAPKSHNGPVSTSACPSCDPLTPPPPRPPPHRVCQHEPPLLHRDLLKDTSAHHGQLWLCKIPFERRICSHYFFLFLLLIYVFFLFCMFTYSTYLTEIIVIWEKGFLAES